MRRAILVGLLALPLLADEPLMPPEPKTVCSPGGLVCADMDPAAGTTVYRKGEDGRTALWEMPGWFRVAFVADDGRHLVTGYEGWNLLARRDPDEVMIRFWDGGKLLRAIPLSELLPDLSRLERTVSHWHWGNYVGFDADGLFVVETVDGQRHPYDVTTGVRREP